MPPKEGAEPPKLVISRLDVKLGEARELEVAGDFNQELPFMIHCKRCGMAFVKEWRQQRLLYRHQRLYPGDCSAPSQFSVAPAALLREALYAALRRTPTLPDITVLDLLRGRVVHAIVDYNISGPAIHVHVHEVNRDERACA